MVNPIATLLLECGAIEFGEFVLASGARSSYYI
ncbi:MAG: orotate phosphoribosyltransferase, partial [Methanomicrobiales archaeon]|nr:orotate phosphoribosyltransferase [Methanomicrobiales archaeon]